MKKPQNLDLYFSQGSHKSFKYQYFHFDPSIKIGVKKGWYRT